MQLDSAPLSKPLVYVVDDSTDYRLLLQQVFNLFLSDYELRLFEDGQTFVNALDTLDQPGLILLDIQMPVLSGCEVVTLIRQHYHWKYVPVVIMSNTQLAEEVSSCYEAGANSFLVKPVNLVAMRQIMQSLCLYWFELDKQTIGIIPLTSQR